MLWRATNLFALELWAREPVGRRAVGDRHELCWVEPADNPWGVRLLDVRPLTLRMISTTSDPSNARNATSFGHDDGTSFIGVAPAVARSVKAGLRFPIDRMLADGALFLPKEMEHKWAIYVHRGQIIFIRSWSRQVHVVAEVQDYGDQVEVTTVRGAFEAESEEPSFTVRVLNYLLRSHALDMVYPAPLPSGMEADPQRAAAWCFSRFGNRVHFATAQEFAGGVPERPLRSYSLLHIAVACGDAHAAGTLIDAGLPVDLRGPDGLAPLHSALAREDTSMLEFLLQRGSPVDVRSDEGATPLMNAAQDRSVEKLALLLDHGADPNAADTRGFTALHRAAEMGLLDVARLLLDRGAFAHPEAHGQTPRSLAEGRGGKAMVQLLSSRREGG